MPKKFSSVDGWIGFVLKMARKGKNGTAQKIIKRLDDKNFSSNNLRLVAQINTRCELFESAESCWREIERRDALEPGDYYMLGSLEMRLSRNDSAISCFQWEIEISVAAGDAYFLDSASMKLAYLMLQAGNPVRAKEAVVRVDDDISEYIDGVGLLNKNEIIRLANIRSD